MYIVKNAWKSIGRAKPRNVLVGIIITTIMTATCIALAVNNSAAMAEESGLSGKVITGQINPNFEKLMESSQTQTGGERIRFNSNLIASLSVADLEKYAKAESVSSFSYTNSVTLGKSDGFEPIAVSESTTTAPDGGRGGFGGGQGGVSTDFRLTGYSSLDAMTTFSDGSQKIVDGQGSVFEFGEDNSQVLISNKVAAQNGLKVGDQIEVVNAWNTAEKFTFTICGIWQSISEQSDELAPSPSGLSENEIFATAETVSALVEKTKVNPIQVDTSRTSALSAQITGTYSFSSKENWDKFSGEIKEMGLSDDYIATSADVTNYEASVEPIKNLSKFAWTLLLIVLIIGGIVLVVLNMINVRERKYEIGVYTAMGIKKPKVALQFAVELLIVSIFAIAIGAGVGSAVSVPVSNALLSNQIAAEKTATEQQTAALGRPVFRAGNAGFGGGRNRLQNFTTQTNFVDQINATVDLTVLFELIGIGLLLSFISSLSAVGSVVRFEPLQILADR